MSNEEREQPEETETENGTETPTNNNETSNETTDIDVSFAKDGGVLKNILTSAPDDAIGPPTPGSEVTAHYTGTLKSDDSKFDSSVDRKQPFKFTIGKGQVIKGWDEGFASMKVGEKALLNIRSDYGYGKNGSPPKIPANADLVFEVELLNIEQNDDDSGTPHGKEKWDMTPDERKEKAQTLKEEATEMFQNKNYGDAAEKYVDAAGYAHDDEDGDVVAEEEMPLYTACWSNAAMCYLKQNKYVAVINACNHVLKVNEENLKAWYRRGVAKMKMEDYKEAKKDLMGAFKVNNKSKEVRIALAELKETVNAAKQKERSVFGGCFEKVSMYADMDKSNKKKPYSADTNLDKVDEDDMKVDDNEEGGNMEVDTNEMEKGDMEVDTNEVGKEEGNMEVEPKEPEVATE